jgi:tetratricopeptide (TPR) repeat protein
MKISFIKKFFSRKKSEIEFRKKLDHYLLSLKSNPQDIRIHIKIAELYLEHNRKELAIDEYLQAAHAYRQKGFKDLVTSIYKHVLTVDPGQVGVADKLVDYYLQQGLTGDAVSVLENLAKYYHGQGKKYEAAQILKRITDTDPDNRYIRLKVAKFYKDQGVIPPVLKNNTPPLQPHSSRSKQKQSVPVRREAFFDLEKTLASDSNLHMPDSADAPEPPDCATGIEQMHPHNVFETLKHIVEEDPLRDTPRFHFNLGMAFYRYAHFEDAVEEFIAALYGYNDKASCYLMLAKSALALNRFEAAEGFAREGLALSGLSLQQRLELMFQLGSVRKAEGSGEQALAIFKSIQELNSAFQGVAEQIRELDGQKPAP